MGKKITAIFKSNKDEETKSEEGEFHIVTKLLEGGILEKQDEDEETKESPVTAGDILTQFFLKIGEEKNTNNEIGNQMPDFIERWRQSQVFNKEQWTSGLSLVIQTLENMVADSPHMLEIIVNSTVLPLTTQSQVVKLGGIQWYDEEESLDVTPQYEVLASVLNDMLKSDKASAVQNFKSEMEKILEGMKPKFEEDGMKEDLLEWIETKADAANKDTILTTLQVEAE